MRVWLREMTRNIRAAEQKFLADSAGRPRSAADRGLRGLTRMADHSKLWFGVAAVLATRPGRWRHAALRGTAAIALTSAITNGLAKPLLPRRRPAIPLVAVQRRPTRRPTSSSFPSGHAASAAAFTTAVAMEAPWLGLALAPLAGSVAYSRVHTGVHWPSDVAFGTLLGAGVAAATHHWWPVHAAPAVARPSTHAAALPSGRGLVILVNPASGAGDPSEELATRWPEAQLLKPGPDVDLIDELDAYLAEHDGVTALGVAGGDGTVAAVASVAARRGLPLLVVPTGTLNHFARDLGVANAQEAARGLAAGSAVHVDLGAVRVDDGEPQWFINTAALGGYPEVVRLREKWQSRWGKWPAMVFALVRVLTEATPIAVRIDGRPQRIWLMFVGSNAYEPKGMAPTWRPRLDDGHLDLRYVRADPPLARLRFLVGAATGALLHNHAYVQREVSSVRVEILDGPIPLATDGEVIATGSRFHFAADSGQLHAYRPEP